MSHKTFSLFSLFVMNNGFKFSPLKTALVSLDANMIEMNGLEREEGRGGGLVHW